MQSSWASLFVFCSVARLTYRILITSDMNCNPACIILFPNVVGTCNNLEQCSDMNVLRWRERHFQKETPPQYLELQRSEFSVVWFQGKKSHSSCKRIWYVAQRNTPTKFQPSFFHFRNYHCRRVSCFGLTLPLWRLWYCFFSFCGFFLCVSTGKPVWLGHLQDPFSSVCHFLCPLTWFY